jgi:hypothetical protein
METDTKALVVALTKPQNSSIDHNTYTTLAIGSMILKPQAAGDGFSWQYGNGAVVCLMIPVCSETIFVL